MTWWRNPREHAVTLRIFEAPGEWLVVEIPAGDAREVPSKYDRGLQEQRDGRIVGGLAPYLVRLDGPPLPVVQPAPEEPVEAEKPDPPLARGRRKGSGP